MAGYLVRAGYLRLLAEAGHVCKEAYIDLEPDHPHGLPGPQKLNIWVAIARVIEDQLSTGLFRPQNAAGLDDRLLQFVVVWELCTMGDPRGSLTSRGPATASAPTAELSSDNIKCPTELGRFHRDRVPSRTLRKISRVRRHYGCHIKFREILTQSTLTRAVVYLWHCDFDGSLSLPAPHRLIRLSIELVGRSSKRRMAAYEFFVFNGMRRLLPQLPSGVMP